MKDYFIVPKEYLKLKIKLIRQSIHGDEEKSTNVRLSLKIIQERFYDQLPEDEQVAVEILQAIDDGYVSENAEFGEGLIEEYFEQNNVTKQNIRQMIYWYCTYILSQLLIQNEMK